MIAASIHFVLPTMGEGRGGVAGAPVPKAEGLPVLALSLPPGYLRATPHVQSSKPSAIIKLAVTPANERVQPRCAPPED